MMPRWLHRLYAGLAGAFWMPCPVCGRMFGGHERPGGTYTYADGRRFVTCRKCRGAWGSWKEDGPIPFPIELAPGEIARLGMEFIPFTPEQLEGKP